MRLALTLVACTACGTTPHASELPVDPPPAICTPPAADEPPITTLVPEPPPAPRLRVVIISEDGMRPDAIDAERAPNHIAMMRHGMTARRAFTVRPSETLCAHASMLSGFGPTEHKMTFDGFVRSRGQIELPTIFTLAREAGLKTAMFIGKQKLWHLAPTGSVDHFEKPGFFCKNVMSHAARYFEANLPDLLFVHVTDPDNAGHEHGWMSPPYLAAVKTSDQCLGMMLDAIERKGVSSSTLLIVTADHGGSGRSHSGRGKDLDRMIPWIVRGPSIPSGSVLDVDVKTEDTAVTALAALQVPKHLGMTGVAWFPPPTESVRLR